MARTKEFDPDQALQRALDVFWRLGYEQSSLEILLREMKISKQSLYDTFGDKRSVYFRAMTLYRQQTNDSLRRLFAQEPSVKVAFAKLLGAMSKETRSQHERGCLLLSANLTRSLDDAQMRKFLQSNQREVEGIFSAAFRSAQARGEIRGDKTPAALAKFFVSTIQGMRALARLNHDRKELEHIAQFALASLN
jgi:TetR/AcrR family transcriptional repressor of nem operon